MAIRLRPGMAGGACHAEMLGVERLRAQRLVEAVGHRHDRQVELAFEAHVAGNAGAIRELVGQPVDRRGAAEIVQDARAKGVGRVHLAPVSRSQRSGTHAFGGGETLVMCSDGLKSRIDLPVSSPWRTDHPIALADYLLAQYGRWTDDAMVIVCRQQACG